MPGFGQRISDYRKNKNITQEELAEAMNVSPQAVSKWENDISCPDITILPRLSDYFGVSIDMLLRGEDRNKVVIVEETRRKSFDQLVLRIAVNSSDGDMVNINLPLALIKAGLEIGIPFLQMANNGKMKDTLRDIDFNAIFQFAEKGLIGKIIDIKEAGGDTVEIFIC